MNQNVVMGIIRHALTFIGGIVIAKGIMTDASVMELSGLIMTAVGTIWSIVDKIKAAKK